MPDSLNPNRLAGSPVLGEPALGLAPVAVVERSPTGLALIGPVLVKVGIVLAALSSVGTVVFTLMLPAPWAVTGLAVCSSVTAALVALGIASPGARSGVGTQPVTLAQPSAAPSAPRMGPPL